MKDMSASKKQIKLIDELQKRGAPIPQPNSGNPDLSMFASVLAEDQYIKQYGYLMRKLNTKMRPDDFGGIPNH
jgi:hypothetical protein